MVHEEAPETDRALAQALARLKKVARERRSLPIGSPEDRAAIDEQDRLCSDIYRLASGDRQ
jgi:sialic acid synthase SpsE